jgi:hypothetical protein
MVQHVDMRWINFELGVRVVPTKHRLPLSLNHLDGFSCRCRVHLHIPRQVHVINVAELRRLTRITVSDQKDVFFGYGAFSFGSVPRKEADDLVAVH